MGLSYRGLLVTETLIHASATEIDVVDEMYRTVGGYTIERIAGAGKWEPPQSPD